MAAADQAEAFHPISLGEALQRVEHLLSLARDLDQCLIYASEHGAVAGDFAGFTGSVVGELDDLESYMSGALDGVCEGSANLDHQLAHLEDDVR